MEEERLTRRKGQEKRWERREKEARKMHKRDEATMGWTDKKRAEEMEWKEHEAKSRCGSFLTCPTHWIAWRGGEDL